MSQTAMEEGTTKAAVATVRNRAADWPHASRFCRRMIGLSLVLLLVVLLLNLIVDPHQTHGTGWVRPITSEHPQRKVFLLQQLPETPELLILGSSRVMTVDPDLFTPMTGYRGFNAGVGSATVLDYLAWLRLFYTEKQKYPAMIVLGIDTLAFNGNYPKLQQAIVSDGVYQTNDIVPGTRFFWEPQDLSWQRSADSLRALYYTIWGYPPQTEKFSPTGVVTYVRKEADIAAGTFDLNRNVGRSIENMVQRYHNFSEISRKAVDIFRQFLAITEENQIRLVVFMTPLHPRLKVDFERRTEGARLRRQLMATIKPMLKDGIFFDATDIASYGGNPNDFFDGVHINRREAARLIHSIFNRRQPANSDENRAVFQHIGELGEVPATREKPALHQGMDLAL